MQNGEPSVLLLFCTFSISIDMWGGSSSGGRTAPAERGVDSSVGV